jgi:L-ascorbate 6-phosphate lactonase
MGRGMMRSARILGGIVIVLSAAISFCGKLEAEPAGDSVLDQIKNHGRGIAIWWTGNDGWLIKSGNLLLGTDLDLETRDKVVPPPVTAEDLAAELDIAFVTHHHGDHFNRPTLKILAQKPRCTFVLPRTCVEEAVKTGILRERIVIPEPGNIFEIKGIRVEPIHAIHGNQDFTVLTRERDFLDAIAHSCGYVFTIQGRRLLQPGDSVLTEEHLNLKQIDVLFVSPTVHNMYIDRSMILINRLEPGMIFPQHFGTYRETPDNQFWTKGYPDELFTRLSEDLRKRYHKLKQGEMFVIN